MVFAAVLGIGSVAIPYVVVPIRRSLGLPTYQWDASPASHPVRTEGVGSRTTTAASFVARVVGGTCFERPLPLRVS